MAWDIETIEIDFAVFLVALTREFVLLCFVFIFLVLGSEENVQRSFWYAFGYPGDPYDPASC